jgi:hypothetical protein
MSPARPENRKRARLLPTLVLFVGASAIALSALWPAFAQETGAIGGAVAEEQVHEELLARVPLQNRRSPWERAGPSPPDNLPVPPYRPTTPAADEPDAADQDSQSLFQNNSDVEDAFGETSPPTPPRRPSTAQQRAQAARERASRPSQSAAERLAAEAQEEDLTAGTVRADTIDSETDFTVDPGAERAEAIEGLDREPEENPYAPLGLRLGTFTVAPTVETGITATSNADSSPNGESAILSETTLRLNGVSDWPRHSAAFEAYATFRESISGAPLNEKEAGIRGSTIIELGNEFRALAGASYLIRPESASSPVVIMGTASRPIRQTLTGNLGLEKDGGKLRLGIDANVERDWYGDAKLSSGGTLSQRERDSTLATLNLRTGYEISPALTPFVEMEAGRRFYDEKFDASGFERSANRLGTRAGLEFDLGEKLSGEFSAGWLREKLDDDRLAAISGATVDADIKWSPMRGTNVGLLASTIVEGTTSAGESGSILYAGRLNVGRELRANLISNVALGASYRDYASSDGHDVILSAEAGTTYWFNRTVGLVGRARHEQLKSNLPGRDSETNSVFLGVKLQR